MIESHIPVLIGVLGAAAVFSLVLAPHAQTIDGFFRGWSRSGELPGALTLTLSQVTTWIFARSLLNAAILGYFFGIAGALAYAAYYASFITGWLIVDRLRFVHRADNIQGFLQARFGRLGVACFNLLITLRLLSEVFANLLVVGIVFGVAGSPGYAWSILAVAGITLVYSMSGGLRASLRTDVAQMALLIGLLAALLFIVLIHPLFDAGAAASSSTDLTNPGWVLLVVALLQVWSYPLHDPVMMDRGFIASRRTTRRSFLHAFWISSLCILAFGLVGVFAGLHRLGDEELMVTLQRLLGTPAMLVIGAALVISAASTMDSTFSSASKLAIMDMRLGQANARNGRIAVAFFCIGGLVLVFLGTDDLFAAVAISGTASLFLTPVIVFCIFGGRDVHSWAYFLTFLTAVGASILYFLETSGHANIMTELTGLEHDYSILLVIAVVVLVTGFSSFAIGLKPRGVEQAAPLS